MALKIYKNKETGEIKKSLKKLDGIWEEQIVAPNSKFMECASASSHRSKLKGQSEILMERARRHSIANDRGDNIQIQKESGMDPYRLLNEKGERKKIIEEL